MLISLCKSRAALGLKRKVTEPCKRLRVKGIIEEIRLRESLKLIILIWGNLGKLGFGGWFSQQ
jgi:hypothetical protein